MLASFTYTYKSGGNLMNKKKTVHIISHTHWDREWYLPYEQHHYLLIEVMDQLLDTLEADPNFKSSI